SLARVQRDLRLRSDQRPSEAPHERTAQRSAGGGPRRATRTPPRLETPSLRLDQEALRGSRRSAAGIDRRSSGTRGLASAVCRLIGVLLRFLCWPPCYLRISH